jgi:hypothetical protein
VQAGSSPYDRAVIDNTDECFQIVEIHLSFISPVISMLNRMRLSQSFTVHR